jgi:hypothetical protein
LLIDILASGAVAAAFHSTDVAPARGPFERAISILAYTGPGSGHAAGAGVCAPLVARILTPLVTRGALTALTAAAVPNTAALRQDSLSGFASSTAPSVARSAATASVSPGFAATSAGRSLRLAPSCVLLTAASDALAPVDAATLHEAVAASSELPNAKRHFLTTGSAAVAGQALWGIGRAVGALLALSSAAAVPTPTPAALAAAAAYAAASGPGTAYAAASFLLCVADGGLGAAQAQAQSGVAAASACVQTAVGAAWAALATAAGHSSGPSGAAAEVVLRTMRLATWAANAAQFASGAAVSTADARGAALAYGVLTPAVAAAAVAQCLANGQGPMSALVKAATTSMWGDGAPRRLQSTHASVAGLRARAHAALLQTGLVPRAVPHATVAPAARNPQVTTSTSGADAVACESVSDAWGSVRACK